MYGMHRQEQQDSEAAQMRYNEYENKISELENINSQILNSNSWKATEKLRKIKRKFK